MRPYGPSDSGRTSVPSLSERTGLPVGGLPLSSLDHQVTPVPIVSGQLNAYEAPLISGSPRASGVSVRPFISRLLLHLFSLFSVKLLRLCAVHLPRARTPRRPATIPRVHTGYLPPSRRAGGAAAERRCAALFAPSACLGTPPSGSSRSVSSSARPGHPGVLHASCPPADTPASRLRLLSDSPVNRNR